MSKPAAQLSSQQFEALLNGPARLPLPRVQSNFIDPANLNDLVILTLTLCLVFAALTVLMRTYTKLFLIRSWDYEDCKFTKIWCSSPYAPRLTTSDALILGWVSFQRSKKLQEPLNFVASSNCTSGAIKTDYRRWRWSSHLERAIEDVLKITLCSSPASELQVWKADCKLGCQCPFDHLQFHRFLHQALNPAPILADFCAYSKGQHGYVPYHPCRYLESPCLLFAGYRLFSRPLQPSQEDLAAMVAQRPLF